VGLKDNLKPQHGGSIFADFKHIDTFKADGTLPNIHKSMGEAMALIPEANRRGAIDFGACHGMLAIRAAQMGWSPVIGVELDAASVEVYRQFVAYPGVTLEAAMLDVRSDHFRAQCKAWAETGINTFLARRVFSELFATTYAKEGATKKNADADPYASDPAVNWTESEKVWLPAGRAFAQAALDAGIRYIVLEGRAFGPYKNRIGHPIYNTEREKYALGPGWKETGRFKEAIVMEPA